MKKNDFMRFSQACLADNALRSVYGGAELRTTEKVGAFYRNIDTVVDGCTSFDGDDGSNDKCDACCEK